MCVFDSVRIFDPVRVNSQASKHGFFMLIVSVFYVKRVVSVRVFFFVSLHLCVFVFSSLKKKKNCEVKRLSVKKHKQ